MSTPGSTKGWVKLVQLAMLAALLVLSWALSRIMTAETGVAGAIGGVGLLLLVGTLTSEVLEALGLPHLTGYILAGVAVGPHAAQLLGHHAVEGMAVLGTLALSLIALAGGAELRLSQLRDNLRLLASATLVQSVLGFVVGALGLLVASTFLPFLRELPTTHILAAAILWGVITVSRSPSATLAVLSQTRATGTVARFTLAFVMSSDVVVLVMLAAATLGARQLVDPTTTLSVAAITHVGYELLSSISLGTTMGLLLAMYLRFVGTEVLIVLVLLGLGLSSGLRYLRFDPLLTFLAAGFFVQNFSKQGHKLLHSIEQVSSLVFVVFFGAAGAHLDLPLLAKLWPVALGLCAIRALAAAAAHRMSCKRAVDAPSLLRFGSLGLISQAGLTLGIAVIVEREFPSFGAGMRSLAVATVALNEMIGPVLFKLALDRAGESARATESEPQSGAAHA
ncbi:MAG: sodium:proton exchanger [Polyangiaceae bacterium]